MDMAPPWGDKITINGIINDGSVASVITPAKMDVSPDTLATLPEGSSDMLGRVTNVESSSPVDGVEWDLGFSFDSANLTAAGFGEENLKIAYLNPDTGAWTEVATTIDSTNKIAYASPTHFSSWTLIATPTPPSPPSEVVTQVVNDGGCVGGGGGNPGITNVYESTTSAGRFTEDVTAKSADAKVKLSIPKNTVGENRVGQQLYTISIKEKPSPGAPPAGSEIIGLVYDIGPSGATFDPPIDLTFTYDESLLPAGASKENLVIATWQDDSWVELEGSIVDPDSNTIIVPVSHFSVFTVIAHTNPADFEISTLDISPATVDPGESVAISATITNTGDLAGSYKVTLTIDQIVTDTREVNLSGHSSQQVTFTTTQDTVGTYQVSINGLPATLTVREVPVKPSKEEPTPSETEPTTPGAELSPEAPAEVQPEPFEAKVVPSEAQPTQPDVPSAPAEPAAPIAPFNLWLIIGIAAGVIVISAITWRLVVRSKAS